jgi:hypothetical protein
LWKEISIQLVTHNSDSSSQSLYSPHIIKYCHHRGGWHTRARTGSGFILKIQKAAHLKAGDVTKGKSVVFFFPKGRELIELVPKRIKWMQKPNRVWLC